MPVELDKNVIMDFSDGEIHTIAWANSRNYSFSRMVSVHSHAYLNTETPYGGISPMPSGSDAADYAKPIMTYTLAPGEGVNGTNAMKIHVEREGDWADLSCTVWEKSGSAPASSLPRPGLSNGYIVPPGMRANRLHIIMRWPAGFRSAQSLLTQTSGSVVQNYEIGQFCDTAGRHTFSPYVKVQEGEGHWYHQATVRHDLAGSNWVHLVLNDTAHHQRDHKGDPPPSVMAGRGGYWGSTSSFYFQPSPYNKYQIPEGAGTGEYPPDGEVTVPYDVYVDSIYTTYEEEYLPINIQIENWKSGQKIFFRSPAAYDNSPRGDNPPYYTSQWYTATCTNTTNQTVSGRLAFKCTATLSDDLGLEFKATDLTTNVQDTIVSFAPGEVKTYKFRTVNMNPYWINGDEGQVVYAAVIFVPTSEQTRASIGLQIPSNTDPNHCFRPDVQGNIGPTDADICHANFTIVFTRNAIVQNNHQPWLNGGRIYTARKNTAFSAQLDVNDINGNPCTFTLLEYYSYTSDLDPLTLSGGGTLTISSSGLLNYTPTTNFIGVITVRLRANNGYVNSDDTAIFIKVTENPRVPVTGGKVMLVGGNLVKVD